MGPSNNVTEFVLLGLTQDPSAQKALFIMFLLTYIVTILGNLLIMVTVLASPSLGSPMYFFLAYLSLMDAVYSTAISPKLLIGLISDRKTISFPACMGQLFIEHLFAGFAHSLIQLVFVHNLPFCGPNVMDHFMCDMYPLLELACTDTYLIGLTVAANGGAICTVTFILLLISYGIILNALKTHSQAGRRKALSTCSSHITVVVLFFIPCIVMYVRPVSNFPFDKFIAIFYTLVTPMLNPLIYTLRNSEIQNSMEKLWCRN
ncbi:Olfactory receptor 4A16 [Heterocephalus glaber]|uniref:Olfactory receptor 4A16 n=1 Tax=Heterocephalus glaber TaxID=10181 RepID=G5AYC6_HETGA|nr:Olfactory receptor 4A16 [Heterocephalus glaber]